MMRTTHAQAACRTQARQVLQFEWDAATGAIGQTPTILVDRDAFSAFPDGRCVDARGQLWIAEFGGGAVHEFTSAGRRVRESVRLRKAIEHECRVPIVVEHPQPAATVREVHRAAARPEAAEWVYLGIVHPNALPQAVDSPVDCAAVEPDEAARDSGHRSAVYARCDSAHHLWIRDCARLSRRGVGSKDLACNDVHPQQRAGRCIPDRSFTAFGAALRCS